MRSARADVVAVSDCEQERETFVIMLDADFAVTAIPTPSTPVGDLEPRAVILSAGAASRAAFWSAAALRQARQRWPEPNLVLVDAPEPVAAQMPRASRASWIDPFSLPEAVSLVTAAPRELSPAAALAEAVRSADAALRSDLETAQVLAALVRAVSRHASEEIAIRLLGEQLRELVERLSWVDWFDQDALSSEERRGATSDLTRSLRSALQERELRAHCRGLDFDFHRLEPCPLSCSSEQVSVLARALRAALLELPPGGVEVDADAGALHCRHAALPPPSQPAFAFDVVASLLRRIDARLGRGEGELTVTGNETA